MLLMHDVQLTFYRTTISPTMNSVINIGTVLKIKGTYKGKGALWIPFARPKENGEQLIILTVVQVFGFLQQLSQPLKSFPDSLWSLSQLCLGDLPCLR